MVKKDRFYYVCSECGYRTSTWTGRCPSCGNWGTIDNEKDPGSGDNGLERYEKPVTMSEVREPSRFSSSLEEFDRVLGGGIVKGSVILLGGEPGIGKSTLLLQVCGNLSMAGGKPLYVSGEESSAQIVSRSRRLGFQENDRLHILPGNVIEEVLDGAEDFDLVVLDSVQALMSREEKGWPGTPSQVRAVAQKAISFAKKNSIPVIIVGHITRAGTIAGPKLLEHMVDVVMQFSGERASFYRILRSQKNRYGSTDESGLFEMNEKGLSAVKDPGSLYWNSTDLSVPGVAMSVVMEGSVPFVVEIQSLAAPTVFAYPKRAANGIDLSKLHLITAVLDKRCSLTSSSMDIYLNVTGGLSIREPYSDLAIAVSIASSILDLPLSPSCCFLGEVGLAGEIRPAPRIENRVKEAERMGFHHIFISDQEKSSLGKGLRIERVKNLSQVLEVLTK
jgi:DNA repair protein RadA/Sms